MRIHLKGGLALPLAAVLAFAPQGRAQEPAPGHEAPKAEPPKTEPVKLATLEEQVAYLQGAMAEAIRTRDWKLLEMALQGADKAGLSAEQRAAWMEQTERQALLELLNGTTRAQFEVWSLAPKARQGDAEALAQLKAWATDAREAVAFPPREMWQNDPDGARKLMEARGEYSNALTRKAASIQILVLMKADGAQELADKLIASASANDFWTMGPVLEALLEVDPEGNWKKLLAFSEQADGANLAAQLGVLQNLLRFAGGAGGRGFQNPVDEALKARLPADARTQLWKPLLAALQKVKKAEDLGQSGWWVLGSLREPPEEFKAETEKLQETLRGLMGDQGRGFRGRGNREGNREGGGQAEPPVPAPQGDNF
ncbi:MAG: hypothetical protein M5U26_02965 [Planctomycetota bacterium]|nr:hypothetical protein [Planctomycetota bacterium]